MPLDIDTFLTTLYVIIDDLYQKHFAHRKPRRPGKRPELSDSEVLTLVVCAQWLGWSERAFVRYAMTHWQPYFPKVLSQSSYNRRSRDLSGVLTHLIGLISHEMGAHVEAYQAIDTVPVPLMRRCRGDRHRLFADEAAIGRGGSDKDWYYGVKLLLSVSGSGLITGFTIAPANTEDRWVAESFLCWRSNKYIQPYTPQDLPPSHRKGGSYKGPTGPIWPTDAVGSLCKEPYIADDGFSGRWWASHWLKDYGATVLTPNKYEGIDSSAARWQHAHWRQIVETVNGQLTEVFGLPYCGARTKWGLLTRVAAKLVALNMGI